MDFLISGRIKQVLGLPVRPPSNLHLLPKHTKTDAIVLHVYHLATIGIYPYNFYIVMDWLSAL